MKKISFICSCYNDISFLDGWVQDLMNQTIIEDCQIVFVDCDSMQNEWELMLEWQNKYPEIFTLIKLKKDKGLYNGWNVALENCVGKYVCNASMDDRRSPLFAEKLYNFLELNPMIDVVYTDNYVSHIPNQTFEQISKNKQKKIYNHGGEHKIETMLGLNLPHVMPVWKKQIHNKVGLFLESYPSCGDWEFWLRATFLGIKFKRFPETLGVYYFNPDGLSTKRSNNIWKIPDENYIRSSYKEYYRNYFLTKEHTYDCFFNWWKSRNWQTHKKSF
jgi:glycosyltransferase involved in cell wall biosynthesis